MIEQDMDEWTDTWLYFTQLETGCASKEMDDQ